MATNNNTAPATRGQELRARRKRLGVSRASLAGLARCSVSLLALVEQGYEPQTSHALDRAFAVLRELEDERDAARAGA